MAQAELIDQLLTLTSKETLFDSSQEYGENVGLGAMHHG